MVDLKRKSNEPNERDYKERFEFVLTTGGNIICQRYFKINNFNPASLRSYELTSAVRNCAAVINRDLKDKTAEYLSIYAPRVFDTVKEMEEYLSNPDKQYGFTRGEGIVVKSNPDTDYIYVSDGQVKELGYKIDDGELTTNTADDNKTTYKFAFKVDGREACVIEWDGYYPKFVRDKIDLSNKRGKFDDGDIDRLTFEQYILYRMVNGKSDLVYGLIKNICYACSYQDKSYYTTDIDDIMSCWNDESNKLAFNIM